jgi:hypothetical protein
MRRGSWLGLLLVCALLVLAAGVLVARTAPRLRGGPAAGGTTPAPVLTPTTQAAAPRAVTPAPRIVPTLGPPAKRSGCAYRLASNGARLPDPACTPGAANPDLTAEVLCAPDFSTSRYRHVTDAQKRNAYLRYGIASHAEGEYEVDHLLALEDGGANDDANLWPEPGSPEPGFHQKDVVETYVHHQVCAGAMQLADAQHQMAADWTVLLERAGQARLPAKQHTAEGDESD